MICEDNENSGFESHSVASPKLISNTDNIMIIVDNDKIIVVLILCLLIMKIYNEGTIGDIKLLELERAYSVSYYFNCLETTHMLSKSQSQGQFQRMF